MSTIDQSIFLNETNNNVKAKSDENMSRFDDKTNFLSLIKLQRIAKKFIAKSRNVTTRQNLYDSSPSGPKAHFFSKKSLSTAINQKLIESEVNAGNHKYLTKA